MSETRINKITINKNIAFILARASNIKTSENIRIAIKTIISETIGENNVRPWRIARENEEKIIVYGYGNKIEKEIIEKAKEFSVSISDTNYSFPNENEELELEYEFVPVENRIYNKRDDNGNIISMKRKYEDAAMDRNHTRENKIFVSSKKREEIYSELLTKELERPKTGLTNIKDMKLINLKFEESPLKKENNEIHIKKIPVATIRFKAIINNKAAFIKYIKEGYKIRKDMGFGSLFPTEVIE